MDNSIILLKTISDIFTAGGAITGFSLLIYVITFQIKDFVTRSYTFLLSCIVIILGTDAFFTTTSNADDLVFLLRVQYIGLIFLPSAYFYFSNALLSLTGQPSMGKRKIFGVITLAASGLFIVLNLSGNFFLDVSITSLPVPSIQRTFYFDIFSVYFLVVMGAVWYNFIRALRRTATKKSKRRMVYLVVAAFGPALGSFPYLLYGMNIIRYYPSIFWLISIIAYFLISVSMLAMTYTVSFFGLPWPDRVIKSRLFKWVMRGPTTAILTLGVTTIISRLGAELGVDLSAIQILGMVATIIIFEFSITIFSPYWERLLFFGNDKSELAKIRQLENRILTKNDLQQFLELVLASFCDLVQIDSASIYAITEGNGLEVLAETGRSDSFPNEFNFSDISENLSDSKELEVYPIKKGVVVPISHLIEDQRKLIGFIYSSNNHIEKIDDEKRASVVRLLSRAAAAIYDRIQQESILNSLDVLTPQVSALQNLLATSRFDRSKIIDGVDITASEKFEKFVKDALGHFFGGPHLSRSPLIQLESVQKRIAEQNEPAITALRAVLHEAIDRLKPLGDRQHTNEWILYNILDYKFIDGWKVRDLCRKLALSEADFYRKQRIAITAVADQLLLMEQKGN